MNKPQLLIVTPGFIKGDKHIKILRPRVEDDFDWYVNVIDHVRQTWFGAECRMIARVKKPLLAEIQAAFPIEEEGRSFNVPQREARQALCQGEWTGVQPFIKNYIGCRSEKGQKAKAARELPALIDQAKEYEPALKAKIINRFNSVINSVVNELNRSYEMGMIQNLTQNPYKDIDDDAGVTPLLSEIETYRTALARLNAQVQAMRNAYALRDLRDHQWVVTCEEAKIEIAPDVRPKIEAILVEGKGFASSMRR